MSHRPSISYKPRKSFHSDSSHFSKLARRGSAAFQSKNVRRLGVADVPRIRNIANKTTDYMFGNYNLYRTVYHSYITLGIEEKGELVGAVCVNYYPNLSSISPGAWLGWLNNLFNLDYIDQADTIWFSLIVYNVRYANVFLAHLARALFETDSKLHNLAVCLPPKIRHLDFLTDHLERCVTKITPFSATSIGILKRYDFFKKYKIRLAVEEDNDDLIPIIDRFAKSLKKHYGHYYIAELLTRIENSTRKIIIAEYGGLAVAVLILNDTVNYQMLAEQFEVGVFHGFKRVSSIHDLAQYRVSSTFMQDSLDVEITENISIRFSQESAEIERARTSPDQSSNASCSEISFEKLSYFDFAVNVLTHLSFKADGRKSYEESTTASLSPADSNESQLSVFLLDTDNTESIQNMMTVECLHQSYKCDPRASKVEPKVPSFVGPADAFLLEVIAFQPDHEEAMDHLLQAAFDCFPNKGYCLLMAPPHEPAGGVLEQFVKITPRSHATCPHELLALHKSALKCPMQVRMATAADASFVKLFLGQMVKDGIAWLQFEDSISNPESHLMSLVMVCREQIVGFAMVNEQVNLEMMFCRFELYHWLTEKLHSNNDAGMLEYLLVYPIFQNYCKFFLIQIHVQLDLNLLLYLIHPDEFDGWSRERHLANAIQVLIPVMPRRMAEYQAKVLGAFTPSPEITQERDISYLSFSTPKYLGIKRIDIGTRIVVVGTGETAQSFLRALIYPKNMDVIITFSNLIVVSPHGIPVGKEPSNVRKLMTVYYGQSEYRRTLSSSLRSYVNSVSGVMTAIDRARRYVVVNDSHLAYDYLVLMCGEQFCLPRLGFHAHKRRSQFPGNAFVVNTENDITNSFNKLKALFHEMSIYKDGKTYVIVYGKNLRTYACVAALLVYGIPKDLLMLVEPYDSRVYEGGKLVHDNVIFPDPEVGSAVIEMVRQLGVTVHHGYELTNWEVHRGHITKVQIASKRSIMEISCICIFLYDEKTISLKTINSLLDCGLVFDGKLVIDNNFRTNDPRIYAAGSMTKYSRKYQTDEMNHVYCNSDEVGESVGEHFRRLLIPATCEPCVAAGRNSLLPHFTRPFVLSCTLPGEVVYLNVIDPGRFVPFEQTFSRLDYGQVLTTGDVKNLNKQGYFRLYLNEVGVVSSITCLSKDPIDLQNIVSLHGKDVVLFNNLLYKYENNAIPDLFDYFRSPFTYGIVLDKYSELEQSIRQSLLKYKINEKNTLLPDKIVEFYKSNNWGRLSQEQNDYLDNVFKESGLIDVIENKVMKYVEDNSKHLSMYAYPTLIEEILHSYENSPMFTE